MKTEKLNFTSFKSVNGVIYPINAIVPRPIIGQRSGRKITVSEAQEALVQTLLADEARQKGRTGKQWSQWRQNRRRVLRRQIITADNQSR